MVACLVSYNNGFVGLALVQRCQVQHLVM